MKLLTTGFVAMALALSPAMAATPDDQLVIGFSMANVITLDPAGTTSKERVQVISNLYDGLVEIDAVDRTKLHPGLAERWEVAPDNRAITFKLRDGAKFASGNDVTAEDVVWSLTRVLKLNMAQAAPWVLRGYSAGNAAENFIAVDARTVEVRLPQALDPTIILMTLALTGPGSILDRQTVMQNDVGGDLGKAWLATNAAGTGPFELQIYRPSEMVVLRRNDNFWGEPAAMDRVLMRHIPESQSQRVLLDKGDLDVGYSLNAADLRSLEGAEGVRVHTATGNGLYYLAMSMADGMLAKPEVREAILQAVDYDGINSGLMPFYGVKHLRPIQQAMGIDMPEPEMAFDPAASKALLAEAGYPDGIKVTIHALAEMPFDSVAAALQGSLAQAGIEAEIITGSGDQVYGAMRARTFQLIVGRSGGQVPHPDGDLRALAYNPDNSAEANLVGLQSWRASFQNAELNARIEEVLLEVDPAVQRGEYEAIQDLYATLPPAIQPISQVTDSVAVRADVEGLRISPVWQTRLSGVTKAR